MEVPDDLRYSASHEWARIADGMATVGITDFAQDELGDVVFVELPATGTMITRGEVFGVIESVKAAVDLEAPVSGEVVARNDALDDHPEVVNRSPYGDGWMLTVRMADAAEGEGLLDARAYRELTGGA